MKPARVTILLLQLLVAGVFIYAGVVKIVAPVRFASDVHNYHLLPWPISVCLAFYLPWLEVLCGLAVLSGKLYRGGLALLCGMTAAFIIAAVTARIRGIDITCGCFGHGSDNLSFTWHLVIDLVLFAALVFLLRREQIIARSLRSPAGLSGAEV